jgi:hypothetical protein
MSKRAFLKTLAFLTGLYFVLEFFLPDKVGGAFDSYAVQAPAPVQTAAGPRLFYAGLYADRLPAVGGLVPAAGSADTWMPSSPNPVLERSPLAAGDLTGMRHLAAVAARDRLELFYLGTDPGQDITLCRASASADGKSWRREPPPRFTPQVPPPRSAALGRPLPNGPLPGIPEGFAAAYSDNTWTFLLLVRTPGKGLSVWRATGADPSTLRLEASPLCSADFIPAAVSAFDARPVGAGWTLYFVSDNQLSPVLVDGAGGLTRGASRPLTPPGTKVTALRVTDAGLYASTARERQPAPPREFSPFDTQLVRLSAVGSGSPVVLHKPGPPPTPTYLSRGILPAGTFLQIIIATALLIPVINLTLFHGKKITRLSPGWSSSIIFFVCLVGMFVVTWAGKGSGVAQARSETWSLTYGFLFKGIVQPMGTAVFSMIAFYMISAAYRSFRVRSLESVLLMAAACIVMIGQMPLGELQAATLPEPVYFLGLPWLSQKLLTVVNACAYRGVLIGLTIGGISIALRIWLGLDNSVYSGVEGKAR